MVPATLTYQTKTVKNRVAPQESFRYLTCTVPPREGISLPSVRPRFQRRSRQTGVSTRPADTRPGQRRGKTAPNLVAKLPAAPEELPDPRCWAAQIARCSLEAVEGERPLTQLNPWITRQQYRILEQRRHRFLGQFCPATAQKPGATRRLHPIRILSARSRATLDGCQEAIVILHDGTRGRASSLRLENHGNRWLVTSLKIG